MATHRLTSKSLTPLITDCPMEEACDTKNDKLFSDKISKPVRSLTKSITCHAGRIIASVSKCIFETWLTKAQLNKESGIRIKSVTPIVTSHTANAGFILV